VIVGTTVAKPILDTHIHLYQVSRPAGVPWPPAHAANLHRDVLPAHYEAVARPLGIVGAGVVEASNWHDDTRWVLDQVRGNDFFQFIVAQLPIGAADFPEKLAEIAAEPKVAGIRGFLWSPALTLEPIQIEHLHALAARGMTLDLISRGSLNPKDKIAALLAAVPELPVIIDHLAGARGTTPDPAWTADMKKLAQHPNLHIKISALYDMFNPGPDDSQPWRSPTTLDAYQPHLDVLLQAFGPRRLIFGSNWPVCDQGGTLARQIELCEEFLGPHGGKVRDQIMHDNARAFYRRAR
jgi:L-fuconolactonase